MLNSASVIGRYTLAGTVKQALSLFELVLVMIF